MTNRLFNELERDIKRLTDSSDRPNISLSQMTLEKIYQLNSDSAIDQSESSQAIQKVNFHLDEFAHQTNLEDKAKNIIKAFEELTSFKKKYYNNLDVINQEIMNFTFNKVETEVLFWQGCFSISVAAKSETLQQLTDTFLAGCEVLAKVIDKRWDFLENDQKTIIKHIQEKIWTLSSKIDSQEKEVDFSVYTIIQASRELSGFVLWRIQELEKEESTINQEKEDDFDVWFMDESDDEEYQRVKEYLSTL